MAPDMYVYNAGRCRSMQRKGTQLSHVLVHVLLI